MAHWWGIRCGAEFDSWSGCLCASVTMQYDSLVARIKMREKLMNG